MASLAWVLVSVRPLGSLGEQMIPCIVYLDGETFGAFIYNWKWQVRWDIDLSVKCKAFEAWQTARNLENWLRINPPLYLDSTSGFWRISQSDSENGVGGSRTTVNPWSKLLYADSLLYLIHYFILLAWFTFPYSLVAWILTLDCCNRIFGPTLWASLAWNSI